MGLPYCLCGLSIPPHAELPEPRRYVGFLENASGMCFPGLKGSTPSIKPSSKIGLVGFAPAFLVPGPATLPDQLDPFITLRF
jgi:hypothetical protein